MFQWIEKQPVRFMGLAWFLSFLLGWITATLIDLVLLSFFPIDPESVSPAFAVSISLLGFTIAGFISGLATATLVRVHKGEISLASFNIIVFGWTITVTVAAMLFFLLTSVLIQQTGAG